jgi:hypothetical protein
MTRDLAPDVATMLRRNRISGAEQPFDATDSYSGARMTRIDSASGRFIVKRIEPGDWLARITADPTFREVQFALSSLCAQLPDGVAVATIDAALDGAGRALLMRDVSEELLPDDGIVPSAMMEGIFARVTRLHARFHEQELSGARVDWCDLGRRIFGLSPTTGQLLVDEGRDFGMAHGWKSFGMLAPDAAATLVDRLFQDPAPLLDRLARLPRTLLHGDLKLANMAVASDGTVTLLDWSVVMNGPIAVELAWLLAVNSSRLPGTLDETIDRYAAHLERESGRPLDDFRWEVQLHVVALSGLMMYGWGKALDAAAGRPDELRWWCDRALAAADALALS